MLDSHDTRNVYHSRLIDESEAMLMHFSVSYHGNVFRNDAEPCVNLN